MRIAICDDETLFLEQMQELMKEISDITQIDCYDDLKELEKRLKTEQAYA